MSIRVDTELRAAIQDFVSGVEDANAQVHGCAIELRVGEIFIPACQDGQPGSAGRPRKQYTLSEGETAVIRTIEQLKMDASHTALVFPVGRVSLQGLLMTNPGHVDPGYNGPLHVTVINMGRESFPLRQGDRLLKALVFKLDQASATPYNNATPAAPVSSVCRWFGASNSTNGPVNAELLAKLSPDFLSVQKRASEIVSAAIARSDRRSLIWQVAIPAIAAIVTVGLTAGLNRYYESTTHEGRIAHLEEVEKQNIELSKEISSRALEKRIDDLQAQLVALKSR